MRDALDKHLATLFQVRGTGEHPQTTIPITVTGTIRDRMAVDIVLDFE